MAESLHIHESGKTFSYFWVPVFC